MLEALEARLCTAIEGVLFRRWKCYRWIARLPEKNAALDRSVDTFGTSQWLWGISPARPVTMK